MRTSSYTIAAGARIEIAASGNYVNVRLSNSDLIIEHTQTSERVEVSQGDDFSFSDFKSLYVTNLGAAQQTIKLTIARDKKAGSAKVGGTVSVTGDVSVSQVKRGAYGFIANQQKTITTTSQQISGFAIGRTFYAIQNKSLTGKVWIQYGSAATQATGLLINPQETWSPGYVSIGDVNAIGDIASNPDLIILEGFSA